MNIEIKGSPMEKKDLIVKHNSLIRSRYDYSLAELRLVITIASMIEAEDEDFREYQVRAQEYADLMGADAHNTRKAVQKLGEMLLSKPLKIPTEKGFAICNWFAWYEYKDGIISCSFHPKLKPYILQLKEQFTRYKLENILRFKSPYSIRLYELAKSWEAKGNFTYPLDELRDILGVAGKYPRYADFRRYIIERAIKEINKLSDIRLSFKEKKLGRKVSDMVFTVKKQGQAHKWLATRKAFISHVRKAYRPHPESGEYPTITTYRNTSEGKRTDLKVDLNGHIYAIIDGETKEIDRERSNVWWDRLYKEAKEGRLKVQSTIDEVE